MAPNNYLPHILVLPEDDADRQIANGFVLDESLHTRRIQVLEEAGGWTRVLDSFETDYIFGMESWPGRFMVLLIDFDGQEGRLTQAKSRIPAHLAGRVFILGALTNPEDLRQSLGGSLEEIGKALAKDCREGTDTVWDHALLRHNSSEVERLRERVRPILFPSN
ncbi:MAG: hypothetical protein WBE38_21010 [Terracidiphilus sp.]|jgi:hypothetical protein